MDLATVRHELYGLRPQQFTAGRNARSAEAREAGDKALATSIRQLNKPSTAAWMANMLVREKGGDIDRLIGLGESLRSTRTLKGEQIRHSSRDKVESVSELLRHAKAIAQRANQPVSQAALHELESTLDAAFADAQSAAQLREGALTTALLYSGLGFESGGKSARSSRPNKPLRSEPSALGNARHALKEAKLEAEHAAEDLKTSRQAVQTAESELKRLHAALTVAERRAAKTREKVESARKKVDKLTRPPER